MKRITVLNKELQCNVFKMYNSPPTKKNKTEQNYEIAVW